MEQYNRRALKSIEKSNALQGKLMNFKDYKICGDLSYNATFSKVADNVKSSV